MGFNSVLRGLGLHLFITVLSMAALAGSRAYAEPYRIVGFGDSLMAGYELGAGESFPEQLEAQLKKFGYEVEVANAGVSGDTTSGGLARLDWSVAEGTEFVILELGANDALRGVPPDVTRANLDEMIRRLKERGVEILLAGMLSPPNMGADFAAEFNSIYPDLAERHDVRLFPFFLEGVAAEPELLLPDGMHPSASGVARIVNQILPTVVEILESLRQ